MNTVIRFFSSILLTLIAMEHQERKKARQMGDFLAQLIAINISPTYVTTEKVVFQTSVIYCRCFPNTFFPHRRYPSS